jgi:hypothetical protein
VDPRLGARPDRNVGLGVAPLALWLLSRWRSVIDATQHPDFHRNLQTVGWWPDLTNRSADADYRESSQVLDSSGARRTSLQSGPAAQGMWRGRCFFARRTWAFGLKVNDLGELFKRHICGGQTVGQYLGTAGGVTIRRLNAAEYTDMRNQLRAWGELNQRGRLPYGGSRPNVPQLADRVRAMYRVVHEGRRSEIPATGLISGSTAGAPRPARMEPWW